MQPAWLLKTEPEDYPWEDMLPSLAGPFDEI